MHGGRKFKVLCLHGYQQNARIFREKMGAFMSIFKKNFDFDFIDAPNKAAPVEYFSYSTSMNVVEDDVRCWWAVSQSTEMEQEQRAAFHESYLSVVNHASANGNFDGILGFSQGAAFAFVLAAMKQRNEIPIDFKFVIVVSGFHSQLPELESISGTHVSCVNCLNIYGKTDKIVPYEKSEELNGNFDCNKLEVIIHPGGHFCPSLSAYKDVVRRFIEKIEE